MLCATLHIILIYKYTLVRQDGKRADCRAISEKSTITRQQNVGTL